MVSPCALRETVNGAVAGVVWGLHRPRLRGQDGGGAVRGARDRARIPVGGASRVASDRSAPAGEAGSAALAVVGLAWPILVTLTPAADRPWISGTSDNSIWSLIFSYNGVGRVTGQTGAPGAGFGGGGGGGGAFGGATGVFRLLSSGLGAIRRAGCWASPSSPAWGFSRPLACAAATRARAEERAVGGAFLTSAAVFSYASGIFHPYYVSFLAPFTAMLIGAGVGEALAGGRVARVAVPAAIVAGAITELVVLGNLSGALSSWARAADHRRGGGLGHPPGRAAFPPRPRGRRGGRPGGPARRAGHVGCGDDRACHREHVPGRRPGQRPGGRLREPGGGGAMLRPRPRRPPGGAGGRGFAPGGAAGAGGAGASGAGAAGSGSAGSGVQGLFTNPQSSAGGFRRRGFGAGGGFGARGFGGGGGFGGDSTSVTAAAQYAKTHGGGTVGVESQSSAASAILAGDSRSTSPAWAASPAARAR